MIRPLAIVPTYNEALNIVPLTQAILALPSQFDVLVVDDHSPDNTADKVLTLANKHRPRIHLLSRPRKLGLGSAYIEGFRWAVQHPYTHVCQLDADLSHDPADLERLLSLTQDYDLVLGTRYNGQGRCEGWAWYRNVLSRMANIYARLFTGLPISDLTGGFKCLSRPCLNLILKDPPKSDGYAFQIESTAKVADAKLRIGQMPIVFRERHYGKSKLSRHIIWEAFWLVLHLGYLRFRFRS